MAEASYFSQSLLLGGFNGGIVDVIFCKKGQFVASEFEFLLEEGLLL